MKIALVDLNHMTRGVHTNTVPLGLGLISRYLTQTVDHSFDIRMYKDATKVLADLKSWTPDVLGLTQYVWNSQLNLYVAALVKQMNPNCLVVAGGPNLEISAAGKEAFLKEHACIDVCVAYDGEIPFAELVKRRLGGASLSDIRENPVPGAYCLHPQTGDLAESPDPTPRLTTLDAFGPVYAEGLFDAFLDEGFHPFVQTHRGCPFTCTFCHTSDSYYSRMLFQSPEIFARDMEALGKRFAGKHNVQLYIANTNMSLFKQDFGIAQIIRDIRNKYDWPLLINVNSGKDPKKLLEMLSIIDFRPSIALQTLTPEVLKNIKRKNIPFDTFVDFQKKVSHRTGIKSGTELILSLPGETKQTFLDATTKLMRSDIRSIVVYTLMNLKGTVIASDESRRKYKQMVRHRVVPIQFSEINGDKIIDSEEVIVGTESLPYDDYLELRGIGFLVKIFFSSVELIPLKRFLQECGVDVAQWVLNIHENLPDFGDLYKVYQAYLRETEEELFPDRETLVRHFERPENWEALCSGRLGQNLIRKYMQIVLYHNYQQYLELALSEARKLATSGCPTDRRYWINSMLDDIGSYLSTRSVRDIIEEKRFFKAETVQLNFDVPFWLSRADQLECYQSPCTYSVELNEASREWSRDFTRLNNGTDLSLQNLYHEEGIENLWPAWLNLQRSPKPSPYVVAVSRAPQGREQTPDARSPDSSEDGAILSDGKN